MDVRKVVGLNVFRLRRERGISQEELSFRSGFGRAYLSGLETGKRNPTVITMWELASALEAHPRELLADPPPDPPAAGPPGPKKRRLTRRQAIRRAKGAKTAG